jgi:hypothetical protein
MQNERKDVLKGSIDLSGAEVRRSTVYYRSHEFVFGTAVALLLRYRWACRWTCRRACRRGKALSPLARLADIVTDGRTWHFAATTEDQLREWVGSHTGRACSSLLLLSRDGSGAPPTHLHQHLPACRAARR